MKVKATDHFLKTISSYYLCHFPAQGPGKCAHLGPLVYRVLLEVLHTHCLCMLVFRHLLILRSPSQRSRRHSNLTVFMMIFVKTISSHYVCQLHTCKYFLEVLHTHTYVGLQTPIGFEVTRSKIKVTGTIFVKTVSNQYLSS